MYIKQSIDKTLNRSTARFCMPGHKGKLSRYDVTELDGTDNLHFPEGAIYDAQNYVSKTMGSLKSFFCVNGSSVGLHAAIMSICKRGDKLIVDRGCHISVINALIINDITPIFIYPKQNKLFGVSNGIAPKAVQNTIAENPTAKGVLITSPTYYGVCSDIRAIAEITRNNNIALIVDEAHGAHLRFSELLPQSAIDCGADLVVQSAHKTLACLTQGAILHICTNRIDPDKIQKNLNMFQTTSPSYLVMSSIESSVYDMEIKGKDALERLIQICDNLRESLNNTGKLLCMSESPEFHDYDKTRLVISSNMYLQDKLHKDYNIVAEMDDGYNLVLIPTIYNSDRDFSALTKAMLDIAKDLPDYKPASHSPMPKTKLLVSPYEAYNSSSESIAPFLAVGKISAQSVYKSPPCMPVICPGELITEEIVEIINQEYISVIK